MPDRQPVQLCCLLLLCLFLRPAVVQAHILSWTDQNGITHYSNVGVPDNEASNAKTLHFEPRPAPQRRSIPLTTPDGVSTRKFVDVMFESDQTRRNISMLVDTGAQMTVIDNSLAEALDIQPEQYAIISGLNGSVVGWVGDEPRAVRSDCRKNSCNRHIARIAHYGCFE